MWSQFYRCLRGDTSSDFLNQEPSDRKGRGKRSSVRATKILVVHFGHGVKLSRRETGGVKDVGKGNRIKPVEQKLAYDLESLVVISVYWWF